MKSVTSLSIDTDRLRKMKEACALHRIPFSLYIEYAIEAAPPLTDTLAQFLSGKKRGAVNGTYDEYVVRKPAFIVKGYHFHMDEKGEGVDFCGEKTCEKERVANPDYYQTIDGDIRSSSSDQFIEKTAV